MVGSWIGLGNGGLAAVVAIGNGGGTMLDVVLCFDLSGSIDDSTYVSIVDRWSPSVGNTTYTIKYDDTLYVAANCTSNTGTSFNCIYPQNLHNCDRGGYNYQRRGTTQNQRAPYNTASTGNTFTDVVINLDEKPTFLGGTFGGLSFPNVGTLVEAARGNLENTTVANNASVPYASWGITPQSGYYKTYWEQAHIHRHPLYDAQSSAANFFQIINNSVNAHFGLVGFASDENSDVNTNAIANQQTHTFTGTTPVAGNIPVTSQVRVKMPWVPLNPAAGSAGSNFTTINTMLPLPPTLPTSYNPNITNDGSTDINGALNQAMNWLTRTSPSNETGQWPSPQNLSRVAARRAIVLFTDGCPTVDTGPNFTGNGGQTTAQRAGNLTIPIYCIGLAQVSGLVSLMNSTLTPIATNSGGKFYLIPPGTGQSAALNRAFSDIARSLVALVR
jgi:hypothetical protein